MMTDKLFKLKLKVVRLSILLSLSLSISSVTIINAQKEPRFGVFGFGGITQPFSDFDYVGEGHPDFQSNFMLFSVNEMLGVTLFHKKGWFSRYFYARYMHSLGAKGEDMSTGMSAIISSGSIDIGLGVNVGKSIWQPTKRWSVDVFSGLFFEHAVERFIPQASVGGVVSRIDENIEYGWLPCIQLGGQINYQLKNIRFSAMLLGNVGTKYIEQFDYRADIGGETYFASVRSKRDVLILSIGGELLFGNKNKADKNIP